MIYKMAPLREGAIFLISFLMTQVGQVRLLIYDSHRTNSLTGDKKLQADPYS